MHADYRHSNVYLSSTTQENNSFFSCISFRDKRPAVGHKSIFQSHMLLDLAGLRGNSK